MWNFAEVGWATIRDKLAFGELDVVQVSEPFALCDALGPGLRRLKC